MKKPLIQSILPSNFKALAGMSHLLVSALILFSNALLLNVWTNKAYSAPFYLGASKTRYKSKFKGQWKVITKVTWSDCDYVRPGEITESEIIINEVSGRLFPRWKAGDWKLVKNKSINFRNDEILSWERENNYLRNSQEWHVRSIDKFEVINPNKMEGESLLRQYLNGRFVGSYMTKSYLIRI